MQTRRRRVAAAALLAAGLAIPLALRMARTGGDAPGGIPRGAVPAASGPADSRAAEGLFGGGERHAAGPAGPAQAAGAGPGIRGIVVDGDGHPVPGAEVAAAGDGDRFPARAISDAEGRFAIPAGAGGDAGRLPECLPEYLVGARAPGFAPVLAGGVRPGGGELRLVLRPGVRLRGSVRDAAGAPCPGARVRAALRFPGVAKDLGGFETLADEEGRYSFAGLSAVEGRVEAAIHGASSGESPFSFPPGVREAEVDLRVDTGFAVEGLVRGAGGAPLAGIQVTAEGPGGKDAGGTAAAWAETGPDGRYALRGLEGKPFEVHVFDPGRRWTEARFPGVLPPRTGLDATLAPDPDAPGAYSFRALDPRGGPAGALRVIEFTAGSDSPSGSTTLGPGTVGPGPGGVYGPCRARAGRYRLLLRGAGGFGASGEFTVEHGAVADLGTLRLAPGATVRGRVLGPGGLPVPGVLLLAGDDLLPDGAAPGPDGRFAVLSLHPGSGVLRVLLPRCEVVEAPWTAGPGAEADLGDLRLRAAAGAIRGTVRAGSGAPVEGAVVRIAPDEAPAARVLGREALTGPDGRFEVLEVPAGRWRTSASPPRRMEEGSGFSAGRAGPVVPLPEGGSREIEIRLE